MVELSFADQVDRSAYDLCNQLQSAGIELGAREVFTEPRQVERLVCAPNKEKLDNGFRKNAQTTI